MQILRGTKREITLMQWNEQLEKAKKKLEDSKQWIEEDKKKVAEIEQHIKEVIAFMDAHNIK